MYPVLHWEVITHCSYKPENTHLSLDLVSHLIFIHENYCEEKMWRLTNWRHPWVTEGRPESNKARSTRMLEALMVYDLKYRIYSGIHWRGEVGVFALWCNFMLTVNDPKFSQWHNKTSEDRQEGCWLFQPSPLNAFN